MRPADPPAAGQPAGRLRHGYTNCTRRVGDSVVKQYAGPEAQYRALAEARALAALGDMFPVPELIDSQSLSLSCRYVEGRHGQELIDEGWATDVLTVCGRALRQLHDLPTDLLGPSAPMGTVIRHGDFGPNNLLLSTDLTVAAVLDWEWCDLGDPITDLAWCEWIVRMHHPAATGSLPALFAAYSSWPGWPERRAEMLRRCRWLEQFSHRWEPGGPGEREWARRFVTTEQWTECDGPAGECGR